MQSFLGKSYSSYGEIIQGILPDEGHFLVSLPINAWSKVKIKKSKINNLSVVDCPNIKTKLLCELLLEKNILNYGYHLSVSIDSQIPVGKGLSSSTADLNAAINAFSNAFDLDFSNKEKSSYMMKVEPHDPVHYKSCVLYRQKEGKLVTNYKYIPNFWIVSIDAGGVIDTVGEHNKNSFFSYEDINNYSSLLDDLSNAFKLKDDVKIASIATESLFLSTRYKSEKILKKYVLIAQRYHAMGIQHTHSGKCTGLLFSGELANEEIIHIQEDIFKSYGFCSKIYKTMKFNYD
jgi:uncharacterized protein involved in propanediol utilization